MYSDYIERDVDIAIDVIICTETKLLDVKLGRDRLDIQIRKLNKVSSHLFDHTVSQIQ